jgi:hypothetical protein
MRHYGNDDSKAQRCAMVLALLMLLFGSLMFLFGYFALW